MFTIILLSGDNQRYRIMKQLHAYTNETVVLWGRNWITQVVPLAVAAAAQHTAVTYSRHSQHALRQLLRVYDTDIARLAYLLCYTP